MVFKDGSLVIGTGTLSGGTATLTVANLSLGLHSLTATYEGDSNFMSSTSSPLTQTVNQGTTLTDLISSINPSIFGNPVIFTANVVTATGSGSPTGLVIFRDGTNVIGTSPLINGVATLMILT